jgi:hypothetical protein
VTLPNLTLDSSERFLTISKTRLPHGDWTLVPLSNEDLQLSARISSGHAKEIVRNEYFEYKSVIGKSDAEIRTLVGLDSLASLKIRSESLEIILLPTLHQFSDGSADLISTVIAHDKSGYRFIGHVEGCVMSVGADLDGDGLPEVIIQNCDSDSMGLSKRVNYMKLYPAIKSIMSFEAG